MSLFFLFPSRIFPALTLFSVLFVASHAALSPEAYWNSVLPNTAMPKAFKDLLNPDGKFHINTVKPGRSPFRHEYAATTTQLRESQIREIFFLEKDLKLGKSMTLKFTKDNGDANFLARSDAEKIPFSSGKISDVFNLYDVQPGSEEGKTMMNTVDECEKPVVKGEEEYCATSLESMVDFSTSKLGRHVHVISTEVAKATNKLQRYIITGVRKMKDTEAVVCHKKPYPYAIFYCHDTTSTKAYNVSLVGADGTNVNAVAVCHTDTSTWNPKHLVFQVLKVQPGTIPVCHFLPGDHIIWVPY